MEREQLSRTLGILMAGMLHAEQQLGARHGGSGVYRIADDEQAPRFEPPPPAKPSSAPPDSSRR